jgi:hypothetical protein
MHFGIKDDQILYLYTNICGLTSHHCSYSLQSDLIEAEGYLFMHALWMRGRQLIRSRGSS